MAVRADSEDLDISQRRKCLVCRTITLWCFFFYSFLFFFNLFADLLSQSTTKSLGNQTVPREFILSYIFVVISAVQMLKIMEKI